MLRKLLAAIMALFVGTPAVAAPVQSGPYKDAAANRIYNLLFCDDYEAFRPSGDAKGPWAVLFAEHPDVSAIQSLANDTTSESRVRALAFNWLRSHNVPVPPKIVLGIIVEVSNEDGHDTLAAYADGRVRYINHNESMGFFEGEPADVTKGAQDLVAAAEPLVKVIGPWDKARLPAPVRDHVRLSFIVSDGLYFGEGPTDVIASDRMSGPLFLQAAHLLVSVVNAMKSQKQQ